jgi:phage major head subunit gpT-like protein
MHTTFGLGVRASFELIEDDEYGLIRQSPQALARSANFRIEQDAANVFNLGFTTITSNDGVSLFNSAHPLLGGTAATTLGPGVSGIISAAGTYPNRPSTDMDLSITSLQTAIRQYERLIDAVGFPVALRPQYLWIPPELVFVAVELLASPNDPRNANNAINSILRQGLTYLIGHYFTSSTAWGLLCEKQFHQLKFFWRHPLEEDFSDDFDTISMKHIAFMRYSVGPGSWLGVWGTTGP